MFRQWTSKITVLSITLPNSSHTRCGVNFEYTKSQATALTRYLSSRRSLANQLVHLDTGWPFHWLVLASKPPHDAIVS